MVTKWAWILAFSWAPRVVIIMGIGMVGLAMEHLLCVLFRCLSDTLTAYICAFVLS